MVDVSITTNSTNVPWVDTPRPAPDDVLEYEILWEKHQYALSCVCCQRPFVQDFEFLWVSDHAHKDSVMVCPDHCQQAFQKTGFEVKTYEGVPLMYEPGEPAWGPTVGWKNDLLTDPEAYKTALEAWKQTMAYKAWEKKMKNLPEQVPLVADGDFVSAPLHTETALKTHSKEVVNWTVQAGEVKLMTLEDWNSTLKAFTKEMGVDNPVLTKLKGGGVIVGPEPYKGEQQ